MKTQMIFLRMSIATNMVKMEAMRSLTRNLETQFGSQEAENVQLLETFQKAQEDSALVQGRRGITVLADRGRRTRHLSPHRVPPRHTGRPRPGLRLLTPQGSSPPTTLATSAVGEAATACDIVRA